MSNDNNIVSTINNLSKNNDTNGAHMSNHPKYPNIPPIDGTDIDCTGIEKNPNKLDMHISCLSHGRKASIPFDYCVIYENEVTNNLYQPTSEYPQLIYVTI